MPRAKKTEETKTTVAPAAIDKNAKILVIVESPNKKDTLSKIFKKLGFTHTTVMASIGHITKISDNRKSYKNTGIHPDEDFKVDYIVDPAKKDVVRSLQKAADSVDYILLMSDPDREGSAISTALKDVLHIPDNKYFRVTTHEITESGVKQGLENFGKIDEKLSEAAKARQIVDKLIGYTISPVVQKNINCRSAGRCQSAGLKLIVEREEEIQNFVPEKYYDLYLLFKKNKTDFRAKYYGTKKKEVKRIKDLETCNQIKKDCNGKPYVIGAITKKEVKESPKPPFTTSTFQQEANRVFGMPITMAMSCAQKLFEGISVKGEHVALITYIRTDDTSMSPDFAAVLAKYVKQHYGDDYYAPVKKGAKNETSQEAHECLRVINVDLKPQDLAAYISDTALLKVYKLIWERTVASSMASAVIGDTQYDIYNGDHVFVMHSREIIFDGYRKLKTESAAVDDAEKAAQDDDLVTESFKEKEELKSTSLQEEFKQTTPPKRYTEASFIKELDKRGIGRPSTFATILQTVLAANRAYSTIEDKTIVPSLRGMELSHFLDKTFPKLINLTYTCELEQELDAIAKGDKKYLDFLNEFFANLEKTVSNLNIEGPTCPLCGKPLVRRKSPYGFFMGCSGWLPDKKGCNYIEANNRSTLGKMIYTPQEETGKKKKASTKTTTAKKTTKKVTKNSK